MKPTCHSPRPALSSLSDGSDIACTSLAIRAEYVPFSISGNNSSLSPSHNATFHVKSIHKKTVEKPFFDPLKDFLERQLKARESLPQPEVFILLRQPAYNCRLARVSSLSPGSVLITSSSRTKRTCCCFLAVPDKRPADMGLVLW